MLVAQCSVLSPDAQTHETFRCSHTQIIDAVEDSDLYFKPQDSLGVWSKVYDFKRCYRPADFRISTPINAEISEIRKIDQGKCQQLF